VDATSDLRELRREMERCPGPDAALAAVRADSLEIQCRPDRIGLASVYALAGRVEEAARMLEGCTTRP